MRHVTVLLTWGWLKKHQHEMEPDLAWLTRIHFWKSGSPVIDSNPHPPLLVPRWLCNLGKGRENPSKWPITNKASSLNRWWLKPEKGKWINRFIKKALTHMIDKHFLLQMPLNLHSIHCNWWGGFDILLWLPHPLLQPNCHSHKSSWTKNKAERTRFTDKNNARTIALWPKLAPTKQLWKWRRNCLNLSWTLRLLFTSFLSLLMKHLAKYFLGSISRNGSIEYAELLSQQKVLRTKNMRRIREVPEWLVPEMRLNITLMGQLTEVGREVLLEWGCA